MEFGRAFSFIFKDPNWFKKIALAGLIGLIPIIGQLYILGWGLGMTRRIINREAEVLPDVEFGASLGTGFKAWVISLVYSIPIFILMIPIWLVSLIGPVLQLDENTLGIVIAISSIGCGGIAFLYSLFMMFVLPAGLGNFVAKNQLGAGLRFGEVWKLVKASPVSYLLVLLGYILAGFIAPLGTIACGIGVILTQAFSFAIIGHLTGQAYNEAAQKTENY